MSKRFGIGEFELEDSPDRPSVWDMRHSFLIQLIECRPNLIGVLFRLFNSDLIPFDSDNKNDSDEKLYLVFVSLFQGNPLDIELRDALIDTPLNRFISSAEKIRNVLATRGDGPSRDSQNVTPLEPAPLSLSNYREPWKAIFGLKEADEFNCTIEKWGKDNNLNFQWIYDFIVGTFFELDNELKLITKSVSEDEVDLRLAPQVKFSFEQRIKAAIHSSLRQFYFRNVTDRIYEADTGAFPNEEFTLLHEKLNWGPVRWIPTIADRTDFIQSTLRDFKNWCVVIREIRSFAGLDELTYRARLESYCDRIETSNLWGDDIPDHREYYESPFYNVELLSVRWLRDVPRIDFVERSLVGLKVRFRTFCDYGSAIETLPDDKLKTDLSVYCDRIVRKPPKGFIRTPVKHDGKKHFDWLIEYQLPPGKECPELAVADAGVSAKAIYMAIKRLSTTIGINLRPKKKSRRGRPPGSKTQDIGSAGRVN